MKNKHKKYRNGCNFSTTGSSTRSYCPEPKNSETGRGWGVGTTRNHRAVYTWKVKQMGVFTASGSEDGPGWVAVKVPNQIVSNSRLGVRSFYHLFYIILLNVMAPCSPNNWWFSHDHRKSRMLRPVDWCLSFSLEAPLPASSGAVIPEHKTREWEIRKIPGVSHTDAKALF